MFLYSAVSSPLDRSTQCTLHFSSPGRPVHSDTNSASLGRFQPHYKYSIAQILFIHIFPPLSIARGTRLYRLLNELGRHGENKNCQASKEGFGSHSNQFEGAEVSNHLPNNIRCIENLASFKKLLRTWGQLSLCHLYQLCLVTPCFT